jgi:hypothetical protein
MSGTFLAVRQDLSAVDLDKNSGSIFDGHRVHIRGRRRASLEQEGD